MFSVCLWPCGFYCVQFEFVFIFCLSHSLTLSAVVIYGFSFAIVSSSLCDVIGLLLRAKFAFCGNSGKKAHMHTNSNLNWSKHSSVNNFQHSCCWCFGSSKSENKSGALHAYTHLCVFDTKYLKSSSDHVSPKWIWSLSRVLLRCM